jgi:putative PEP-CTERM system histidine kinase
LTDGPLYNPAFWSHGIAAILFAGFALRLGIAWRGGLPASMLLGAIVANALWASAVAAALAFADGPVWWTAARVLDVARIGAWLAFLALLLDEWQPGRAAPRWATTPRWLVGIAVVLLALSLFAPDVTQRPESGMATGPTHAFTALLGLAVLGLVLVEQLWRRTPEHGRWGIKPLVVGLAGVFAFDLFLYSDATLFRHLDPEIWAARGLVHALVIPLLAVATARNTAWTVDLHLSRSAAFSSTALLISGVYLLVVAGAGYWVRLFGGSWGKTLQVAFVFAALIFLAALAFSGTLRSRLKVFVSKHFFSYRYDYRQEWLRFTALFAGADAELSIHQRAVRALADLVESPGGGLWLKRERVFRQVARWNAPEIVEAEPLGGALPAFLAKTGWVVDLREQARRGPRAVEVEVPRWLGEWKEAWIVVPLVAAEDLVGFVVLANPRVAVALDWEVLDLLKTAGRQAASYLGQIESSAALLEAEKFAAFNRMSAFVVHDLKNLVAQLSLMLKNAERHSENPEFQRDMLATVRHVVERMNGLLLQLRLGTNPVENAKPVDLSAVARRVGQAKAVARPGLSVEAVAPVFGLGHEDRLEHVVGHLVQNAIDATRPEGRVAVRVAEDGSHAVVEVEDDGEGMTREFVQTRLFKPFQTTKREGMGIGTYESQQYVSGLGGTIAVDSAPGRGTKVRLLLPRAGIEPHAANDLREVA